MTNNQELIAEARTVPIGGEWFTRKGKTLHSARLIRDLADALEALTPRVVSTVEELDALPVKTMVLSAKGTIACRFNGSEFVVLGDDRLGKPWLSLALPATVLYTPPVDALTIRREGDDA